MLRLAENLAYSCSFQPSHYFGLNVRSATTVGTRVTAVLFATPPMVALLFIYGLLVRPIKFPQQDDEKLSPGELAKE
jgi:hypothetical protein